MSKLVRQSSSRIVGVPQLCSAYVAPLCGLHGHRVKEALGQLGIGLDAWGVAAELDHDPVRVHTVERAAPSVIQQRMKMSDTSCNNARCCKESDWSRPTAGSIRAPADR